MDNNSLDIVLKECEEYAKIGYKIASDKQAELNKVLNSAAKKIDSALSDFEKSPCYFSGATDLLSQQLIGIRTSFDSLSTSFQNDLRLLSKNMSKFSITLFGRTMAGKSTLMEILTQGDGQSIGKGAQRTTRDVRKYTWKNMEITDVPGIGAFEGEEDEQIAFEAAKTADLILFLLSDDGPQAKDAECFAKIFTLGKPVVCVMNVKASVSESKSMKMNLRDIKKAFDFDRLADIRKQFLVYAKEYAQDWSHVPYINVHLKAAFMAQNTEDEEISRELYNASCIGRLKAAIISRVQDNGKFYRIKTFIDIISNPMLESVESLIEQSLVNGAQGRTILSKRRALTDWKHSFWRDSSTEIDAFVSKIRSQLNSEVAEFAEENCDDENAAKNWEKLLSNKKLKSKCEKKIRTIEEKCNDKIAEVTREIGNELKFVTAFNKDGIISPKKITDWKKVWGWTTLSLGGGLTITAIILGALGAAAAGPVGWAALAVSLIGGLGSLFFKSRAEKEYEARRKLENSLRRSIDTLCKSIQDKMYDALRQIVETRINTVTEELSRLDNIVFSLADTQKELAWNLNGLLSSLNLLVVENATKLVGLPLPEREIQQVARIPGSSIMIVLKSGKKLSGEYKKQLYKVVNEFVSETYQGSNKRSLISRVIGPSVDYEKIYIEEKIDVAHIVIEDNVSADVINRIRMAQLISQTAIKKRNAGVENNA